MEKLNIDNSLNIYLSQIREKPLVEIDKEKQYIKEAKKGNKASREMLIEGNLRLVVSIAKKFISKGLELEDLIQEGNIGLMKSIDKFDLKQDVKFSTYATWWIKQSIMRAIDEKSRTIRVPGNIAQQLILYRKKHTNLENQFNREPKIYELAEVMNLPEEKIKELMRLNMPIASIDFETEENDNNAMSMKEYIIDENNSSFEEKIIHKEKIQTVRNIMSSLNENEQKILTYRYGFKTGKAMSLRDASPYIGLSKERIRQIEKTILENLREKRELTTLCG